MMDAPQPIPLQNIPVPSLWMNGDSHAAETRPGGGPSTFEIEKQPWRYVGYKRYADFISSDDDLFVFRRFRELNARVALRLQDRVTDLEERLKRLDEHYSSREGEPIHNGSFRDDMPDREEVLNEITVHINRYNQYLLQQSELARFEQAPRRDVKSLKRWHNNHQNKAISAEEHEYLNQDDLVCVHSRSRTPFRKLIDKSLLLRTLRLWRDDSVEVPEYESKEVSYYSDKRMDAFASGTIVAIGATVLLVPLWILQSLENLKLKLIVITTFVFVFLLVLSFAMVAKPFEALGATAAYAAVLMVFIQVDAAIS